MKDHLAARRNGVHDVIALADRAASRKHHQIGLGAGVERCEQRLDRVLRRPVRFGQATVRRDDRAERETVDVVDVAGRQRLSRLDDLVPRGQDRDARPGEHHDVRAADRRDRADAAGQ